MHIIIFSHVCFSMNNLDFERKPLCKTTKSALFTVSKDEWDTKGKSMKNVLYILQYMSKGTSRTKATPNNEKSSPLPKLYYRVTLAHQSVSYLLSRKFCLKNCKNCSTIILINMKGCVCMGLVLPSQYCFVVIWEN